jgi:hypothetical protein
MLGIGHEYQKMLVVYCSKKMRETSHKFRGRQPTNFQPNSLLFVSMILCVNDFVCAHINNLQTFIKAK